MSSLAESSSRPRPSGNTLATSRSFKVSSRPQPDDPIGVLWSKSWDFDNGYVDTFTKHQIERTVPVQALTKCKMQDNLEFLQWSKRFWDQYYPGGEYDAHGRRGGVAVPGAGKAMGVGARSGSSAARRTPTTGSAPRLGVGARAATAPRAGGMGSRAGVGGGVASAALTQENDQLKETVQGLERERDFYFSKLRDIELLIQQAMDENPELEKDDNSLLKSIQEILYSTEEGFEIPEGEGEEVPAGEDLETF